MFPNHNNANLIESKGYSQLWDLPDRDPQRDVRVAIFAVTSRQVLEVLKRAQNKPTSVGKMCWSLRWRDDGRRVLKRFLRDSSRRTSRWWHLQHIRRKPRCASDGPGAISGWDLQHIRRCASDGTGWLRLVCRGATIGRNLATINTTVQTQETHKQLLTIQTITIIFCSYESKFMVTRAVK